MLHFMKIFVISMATENVKGFAIYKSREIPWTHPRCGMKLSLLNRRNN